MKWTWKLCEFRGIGVYVHATFLLLIAYVIAQNRSLGVWEIVNSVLFVLAIFACVVLHEFGHALTAARYGIKTQDIILLPIGGVARLERMPDKPIQELWVALAGPAVNVVIAAGLFLWLKLTGIVAAWTDFGFASGPFLVQLMIVNIFLLVFNMLPAFPMDGGRVVRALLATQMDYVKATQIAARLGQVMALLFGLFGLYASQPFLVFIALFVWLGAAGEVSLAKRRAAMEAASKEYPAVVLSPNDTFQIVVNGQRGEAGDEPLL